MNLVIFTPALKASAIGRVVRLVTSSLIEMGHQVTIVRTETEALLKQPTHDFEGQQVAWNDSTAVEELIKNADEIVYQIGDNYDYHEGCIEWLPRYPGIVCLHDFFIGNLFLAWASTRLEEGKAVLRNWYGDDAATKFFEYRTIEEFIDGTHHISPMTEWICSMATGVITHSSWGVDRVLKSCAGPVFVAPLPYNRSSWSISEAPNKPNKTFEILTIGNVNENKRAESVIKAISTSRILRDTTVYHLVGAVRPNVKEKLNNLAAEMKVKISIAGEVSDERLTQAIHDADVISCLRWPSLEAASASAIEALLYGKATVVTNVHFYAELPDEYVSKVEVCDEISSLRAVLEKLFQNPVQRQLQGEKAQRWAVKTFSSVNYAARLAELASLCSRVHPTITMTNHFVSVLKEWQSSNTILNLDDTVEPLTIFS